jgi:hypothetical protein
MINATQYRQMVSSRADALLKDMVEKDAAAMVANITGNAVIRTPGPTVATPVRRRGRRATGGQFAPKGSWIGLGKPSPKSKPLTGQLAQAMTLAEHVLATGPSERGTLTNVMVDANDGWVRNTASSCISRLVAAGRLIVVAAPTGH